MKRYFFRAHNSNENKFYKKLFNVSFWSEAIESLKLSLKSRPLIPISLLILIILIPIFILTSKYLNPKSEAAWFDESFQYRKAVDITNTSGGILTDFQVSISVGTSAPIATGKMKSDCRDIRITDQNGNILPHWIEENNPGCNAITDAKVWVKVPSIPISGATLYVYYGNPSAPNIADGNKVFEFFDDFSQNNIGTTWQIERGSPAISGGTLNLISNAGVYNNVQRQYLTLRWRGLFSASGNNAWQGWNTTGGLNGSGVAGTIRPSTSGFNFGGGGSECSENQSFTSPNPGNNAWHSFEIQWNPVAQNMKYYIDESLNTTTSACSKTSTRIINFNLWSGSGPDKVDWVLLKKYASADPTTNTSSNEEKSVGPAVYWKLDEGVGSTVYDSTSNKLNGNILGSATWKTESDCMLGKCLSFDGVDDYATGTFAAPGIGKPFTMSAWFKTSTNYAYSPGIISIGYTPVITMGTNGKVTAWWYDGAAYPGITSVKALNDGYFHYVTLAYDGTTASLYVDGIFQASRVSNINSIYSGFYIGNEHNNGAKLFNGLIDDAKAYLYARTATQIAADYVSGLARQSSQKGTSVSMGSPGSSNLSNGLVGYWKMDEASAGTGSTAYDASGNGNNGIGTGTSVSYGKFGNGRSFNGSGDYLNMGADSSLAILNNLSLSFWIKLNNLSAITYFVDKHNSGNNGYFGYIGTDGSIMFRFGVNSIQTSSGVITADTWTHVDIVGDSNKREIYVNGLLSKSIIGTNVWGSTTDSFYLGNSSANEGAVNGSMDEVRVYNRALSQSEITALYNFAPGPINYWTFEEGSGSIANDRSGSGNNAAFGIGNSAPVWVEGKYGKGLKFNSFQYLGGNYSTPVNTKALTYSAWLNFSSTSTVQRLFYGSGFYPQVGFNGPTTQIFVHTNTSTGTDNNTPNISLPASCLSGWHYLTTTWDTTLGSNNVKVYCDGINFSNGTLVNSLNGNFNINSFMLGYNASSQSLNGSMDEVKIYNYARTQKQIVEDMNGSHPAGGSPVGSQIQYWNFDGTLNSAVPNGNAANPFGTGTASYTPNGKFGKALDFTELYSGNFTYTSSNTFTDASKNWTTNQLVGYQFGTDYGPNNEYCQSTIISNTATTITFSGSCSSFAGNKYYRIKKSIYVSGPVPNHSLDKISASLWFRSNGSQNNRIARANNEIFHFSIGSNSVYVGALSYANTVTYITNPHDGNWHYLALVYDGATQKIYYDGTFRNSNALTGAISSGGSLTIGARNDGDQEFFNGQIDEIKVYGDALTDDEIKLDYNNGQAMQMGTLSSGTGNTAPSNAASQEYCVPGDAAYCTAPVGEWKFEEGIGSTAYDKSGNNYNGTLGVGNSAPSWTEGKSGKGLSFNGNNYVDNNTVSYGDVYTVEAWIKPTDLSILETYGRTILASSNSNYPIWLLVHGNQIRAYAYSDSASSYYQDSIFNNIQINNWYHISLSATRNGVAKLYINGVLDSTFTSGPAVTNLKMTLGDLRPNRGLVYKGAIDEVKIYNYLRTPAQIAWDYNHGAPVGWWEMDECQGNIAHDSSGNRLDGTINIGVGGSQTSVGTCSTAGTAWGNSSSGKYNSGLNFDGEDDYVNVPNNTAFNLAGTNHTFSVWIKTMIPTDSPGMVLQRFTGGAPGAGYYFAVNVSGAIYHNERTDGGNSLDIYSTNSLADSSWHNVVIVVDINSKIGKIYVDGKYNSQDTYSGNLLDQNGTLTIGGQATNYSYKGLLDDVKIFNYALTDSQIKSLYNNGAINFGPASGAP